MKIKQITEVELEDSEINALQAIARIECPKIDCNDCPLETESGECIKGYVKRALCASQITW